MWQVALRHEAAAIGGDGGKGRMAPPRATPRLQAVICIETSNIRALADTQGAHLQVGRVACSGELVQLLGSTQVGSHASRDSKSVPIGAE